MPRMYRRDGRFYGDFRDIGGGREALAPEGGSWGTTELNEARRLFAVRRSELDPQARRGLSRDDGAGQVYVLGSLNTGRVKIGKTMGEAENRRKTLQCGSPVDLFVFMAFPTEDRNALEKKIHERFEPELTVTGGSEFFHVRGVVYRDLRYVLIRGGTLYDLRTLDELRDADRWFSGHGPRCPDAAWKPPVQRDPFRRRWMTGCPRHLMIPTEQKELFHACH